MKLRKVISILSILAIGLAAATIARGDESVQVESAKVSPTKLPKKSLKPIQLTNLITTSSLASTGNQPPSATRTILDLPKQVKANTSAAKTCKVSQAVLASSTNVDAATQACGKKSLVTKGGSASHAQITVGPANPPTIIDVDVAGYNAKGDKLYIYAKPTGNFSSIGATILTGKLLAAKKVKNRPSTSTGLSAYKQSLDVSIPPVAAGAISSFKVTIAKSKFLQAKCSSKNMQFQATTSFTNHDPVSDTSIVKCKKK